MLDWNSWDLGSNPDWIRSSWPRQIPTPGSSVWGNKMERKRRGALSTTLTSLEEKKHPKEINKQVGKLNNLQIQFSSPNGQPWLTVEPAPSETKEHTPRSQ